MTVNSGLYHITNVKSGTALDQSGTDQKSIIGWPSHNGENQKWYINQRGNGRCTIKNNGSGRYIGFDNQPRDDARAIAVDYEHEWEIRPDEQDNTVYRIFAPGTPFNLDLTNFGDPNGGTPVAIWGDSGGRHQCWRLNPGPVQ